MAMGNIMFLTGFPFLVGLQRSLEFFALVGDRRVDRWKSKWRGYITFFGGVFLVLCGYGALGSFVEVFGILNLFGNFFPVIFAFLRNLPYVGVIFNLPGVNKAVDTVSGRTAASMV